MRWRDPHGTVTRWPNPRGPVSAQFATGRYNLHMVAYDFSTNPLLPACPGSLTRAGKSVYFQMTVVRDGVEWVGRSSGVAADIEMRFRDAGELPLGGRALSGTIRGQAPDMGFPGLIAPRDVTVTVAGTVATGALFDAETMGSVNTLIGRAVGEFRFHDSAGSVVSCPEISLQMNVQN